MNEAEESYKDLSDHEKSYNGAKKTVDGLNSQLDEIEKRLPRLKEDWDSKNNEYQTENDKLQKMNNAYICPENLRLQLAQELEDGKPCPICGSAKHPLPANKEPMQEVNLEEKGNEN